MVKIVYHAADGTQHASRAGAQRYERAVEFCEWLNLARGHINSFPLTTRDICGLAQAIAERWYLLDRNAKRKRGSPRFTGELCPKCGGQLEAIAGVEVCATCDTEAATRLRKAETGELKAKETKDAT